MYSANLATESHGTDIIVAFLNSKGVLTELITDPTEQKTLGDLRVTTHRGTSTVELKIERRGTGNVYIELFSNLEWGKTGWLFSCHSEKILFYFLDSDQLYGVSLPALKQWLLNQTNGTLFRFPIKKAKASGPNDTWGVTVPVNQLRDANLDGWWEATPKRALAQHAFIKTL